MYLESRRKNRRRSSPVRVLILLALIGAALYVYFRIKQKPAESPFVPTPTPTRSASFYTSEADRWYWKGDLSKAIAAYEKALTLESENVDTYISLARLLALEGRTLEAVQRAKRAVDMAPDNARAWAVLGMAYDWNGEVEEAIQACQRALEIQPDSASGNAYLAEAYADAGNLDQAAEIAQTAVKLSGDDPKVEIDAYRNYGYVLERQGSYWLAIEEYKKALDINPNLAYIHIAIGKNHLTVGDFDTAMRSFEEAAEVDPDNAEAYYRMGRSYYEIGEHGEAQEYLKQATELGPEFGPAFGYLGFTYWSRRNYEDTIPNLERAIALECVSARRKARAFAITVEARSGGVTEPSSDVVMSGDFVPVSVQNRDALNVSLEPTREGEEWQDARGTVTLDMRSGRYTVTLKEVPQTNYGQAYVGWFRGLNELSGDPVSTGPLSVGDNGSLEAGFEAVWVEGPRIEYFYTLGLAHFYMAECEKAYPLFEAALRIDPEEENALKGIRLCQDAESEQG